MNACNIAVASTTTDCEPLDTTVGSGEGTPGTVIIYAGEHFTGMSFWWFYIEWIENKRFKKPFLSQYIFIFLYLFIEFVFSNCFQVPT